MPLAIRAIRRHRFRRTRASICRFVRPGSDHAVCAARRLMHRLHGDEPMTRDRRRPIMRRAPRTRRHPRALVSGRMAEAVRAGRPDEGAKLERTASGYTIRTERIVNAFDERVRRPRTCASTAWTGRAWTSTRCRSPRRWCTGRRPASASRSRRPYNDAAAAAHASHPDALRRPRDAADAGARAGGARNSSAPPSCPACAACTWPPTSTAPTSTSSASGTSMRRPKSSAGRSSCTRSTPSAASAPRATT